MDKDNNSSTKPWKNTTDKNKTTSKYTSDFPPTEVPTDVIPDEVPRKDGPGGE